jgi:hypothetical protein
MDDVRGWQVILGLGLGGTNGRKCSWDSGRGGADAVKGGVVRGVGQHFSAEGNQMMGKKSGVKPRA